MRRREFLKLGSLFLLVGCKQEWKLPVDLLRLGKIEELLNPIQHVKAASMIVFRDKRGWRALGARCSLEGCDLSFFQDSLLCPCCNSAFSLTGRPIRGKASKPLGWYKVGLKESLVSECKQKDCRGAGAEYPRELKSDRKEFFRGDEVLQSSLFVHTGLRVAGNSYFFDPILEQDVEKRALEVARDGSKAALKAPRVVSGQQDGGESAFITRSQDYEFGAGKKYDVDIN